jgi:hypothetical protein
MTYGTGALRVIVVTMNGEDWNRDIQIRIFVIDSREATAGVSDGSE